MRVSQKVKMHLKSADTQREIFSLIRDDSDGLDKIKT